MNERHEWLRRQITFRREHITFLHEEIEALEREIQREEFGMFPLRVSRSNAQNDCHSDPVKVWRAGGTT
jgi:hypothetical protein